MLLNPTMAHLHVSARFGERRDADAQYAITTKMNTAMKKRYQPPGPDCSCSTAGEAMLALVSANASVHARVPSSATTTKPIRLLALCPRAHHETAAVDCSESQW
jgi:hypothetical protein